MEVGTTPGVGSAGGTLGAAASVVKTRGYPLYEAAKVTKVALGGAPVVLAPVVVGTAMKAALGPERASAASSAALMADGLVHGLWYRGGILHQRTLDRGGGWLVSPRAVPEPARQAANVVGRFSHVARFGLLGAGGVLGAIRAAEAVSGGGTAALYATRDGRGGVLQAVGSALLVVKHPVTYLAGAAVFGLAMVNDLI